MQKIIIGKSGAVPDSAEPCAIALGFFDGVHKGHLDILKSTLDLSSRLGIKSAVFTFFDTEDFKPEICRVTSEDDRLAVFESLGFDFTYLCPFSEISRLSGREFCQTVLKDTCKARYAVCGENFRFGNGALCGTDELSDYMDGNCLTVKERTAGSFPVSSTYIRSLIEGGDIGTANGLLYSPFSISGKVVHGKAIGRKMDIPTVNLIPPARFVTPKRGVYITETEIDKKIFRSVTNVGVRPTVGGGTLNLETHIIGENIDAYGKQITVTFIKYLRGEAEFESMEKLKEQINKDIKAALKYGK